jgi:hypothetical protein
VVTKLLYRDCTADGDWECELAHWICNFVDKFFLGMLDSAFQSAGLLVLICLEYKYGPKAAYYNQEQEKQEFLQNCHFLLQKA